MPDAKEKIRRYCAYQERCHREVRDKLFSYGLPSIQVEEIMVSLIDEGFLNEERFARSFAGGKFRMKKWGRLRIANELEARGITKNCIRIALQEIDGDSYRAALRQLLEQKNSSLEAENLFIRRDKLSKYAIMKGYEPDLVWPVIRELLPD